MILAVKYLCRIDTGSKKAEGIRTEVYNANADTFQGAIDEYLNHRNPERIFMKQQNFSGFFIDDIGIVSFTDLSYQLNGRIDPSAAKFKARDVL